MRKTSIVIMLGLLLAFGTGFSPPQSGYDLFQKALVQERTEGNLQQAIDLYQRIVRDFSSDRPLAAKALFQIGQCYEKLGKDEARKAYERLVRDYADQSEEAKLARARLAALRKPVVNESGMATRQVWAGPDTDSSGEVSPDGRYLSYVNWVTGDLAVRDLASGESRMLTSKGGWKKSSDFALDPRWSPDGKLIAYAWLIMPYEENPPETWELRITDLSGKNTRVLHRSTEEFVFPAGWFPDGRSLLAITQSKGPARPNRKQAIVRVSVEDGTISVLKMVNWPGTAGRVCLSPDGKYVAFEVPSQTNWMNSDLFVLPAEGGGETPLVTGPNDDRLLAWTPDGRSLLFLSNRSGTYDVWLLRMENGKAAGAPELLKQDFGMVGAIGFSPDGKFYYTRDVVMHDIFVADFDAEAAKPVSTPKKATEHFAGATTRPAWSADGKKLAYVVHRGPLYKWANDQVRIRDLESGDERTLPKVTGPVRSPSWSPDGSSLLLCRAQIRQSDCQIVDTNSGNVVHDIAVRREYGSPTSAVWAPDGSTVYYATWVTDEGRGRIVRRDLGTGEEKVLYSLDRFHNPINLAVSPDGKYLAFSLTGLSREGRTVPSSILVIPTAGGEARELVRIESPSLLAENTLAWSPDSRHVLFGQESDSLKTTKLYRVALSGGKPQYLEFEAKEFTGLRLRPDGRQIAFTLFSKRHGEVWVMENFLSPARSTRASK